MQSSHNSCGATINQNNTKIQNAGFPNDVMNRAVSCRYTIEKCSSDIVQFRLDFIVAELSPPDGGDCNNDRLTITGADEVTTRIMPTNLCGKLTRSHVYISVKDKDRVTLDLSLSRLSANTQVDRKWNIMVSQISSTQTELLAPRGCLQYFREDRGTLETFNFDNGNGQLLNNHMYTMCIEQNDLFCDVAISSNMPGSFDLGGSSGMCDSDNSEDSVMFGTNQLCGETFGTNNQFNWIYTGPYIVAFISDGTNPDTDNTNTDTTPAPLPDTGFSLDYFMMPCA